MMDEIDGIVQVCQIHIHRRVKSASICLAAIEAKEDRKKTSKHMCLLGKQ